jgi:hypothetical protein
MRKGILQGIVCTRFRHAVQDTQSIVAVAVAGRTDRAGLAADLGAGETESIIGHTFARFAPGDSGACLGEGLDRDRRA